jgi:hypothetical protein
MAKNIKQSIQGFSPEASTACVIRWDSLLEVKLTKFGQPALLQAFQIALDSSSDQFIPSSAHAEYARVNPHRFTEASFPLDMPAVYAAYEKYDSEVCDKEVGPDFSPTFSGYIAWLAISKLWRIGEIGTNSAGQVFMRAAVKEITGICLLAERAERILRSEERAVTAAKPLNSIRWKTGKKAEHLRATFWESAEDSLLDDYACERGSYPSLEVAAMHLCEVNLIPFDFIKCYQILLSFEEQM